MKHKHKIVTLICCAFTAVVSGCARPDADRLASAASASVSVIPAPRDVVSASGQFDVTTATKVIAEEGSAAEGVARYFVDLLQRTGGPALQTQAASSAVDGGIRFELVAGESSMADEAYTLAVSPGSVSVSAADSRGLFYGAVTLWQLMTPGAGDREISLPAMKIEDAPRFPWRGLMLDSARHFQSPEFIKQFIDWMALHKLNVFHWHLVDDQAWRIEIKKYPLLTERGAWRVPAGSAPQKDIDPKTGKPRLYGGYYTQEEIRDIVAYASARHITIVPEIEMPGHATAAIVAYPELAAVSNPPREMPADWGIYPHLFNVEDATFAFLEDVMKEVMALFPSPYIHVGGDEAVKEQWEASPRVQARMREFGIKDEHALQSYFIQRMEKFLSANGRRLIGWDEILEGGLAANATVMSWRGIDGAVAAAAAGHDAVLSPWPTLYFDNRQSRGDTQPGRGTVIGVEEVYRFDPLPPAIQPDQRKHVLGIQANLWTEHMRTDARVEYMAFPRAAALAEIAWSAPERISFADFQRRLPAQLARYDALGVRYAPSPEPVSLSQFSRRSHELDLCSDKLVLSLEDDAPVRGERETFLVDVMEPCWMWRGVDLSSIAAIEVEVGQVPFNFQIGKDRDAIKFATPRTEPGELEIRAECKGPVLAVLPLEPARDRDGVTSLPATKLSGEDNTNLCFTFAQPSLDPLWVVHRVTLHENLVTQH
jgi:hexosaminidase